MLLGDARKKRPSSKNISAFIENNPSREKKDYSRAVIKKVMGQNDKYCACVHARYF